MSKSTTGFSLIEIVVVIGIMGLLTAIIYSSFDSSKAGSRDQKRVSDISTIQLALELYFNKNGVYPVSLDTLLEKPVGSSNSYLVEIPKDPSTNKLYNDMSSSNSGYFPITKKDGSDRCVSYQLWTTFEKSNAYLESKRGFNSVTLPGTMYECGTGHNKVNASASVAPLVYDVMP